jgi:bifunctional UDP-N-acetylglucosamine pyrophosphorylase/glucosamine-1-phosphate N-acetyltransferase
MQMTGQRLDKKDYYFLSYYFKHLDEFPMPELFLGCEFPWQVLERAKTLLNERGGYVSPSAKIHKTAEIVGPVWIGDNCEIGHGALIRPFTILGVGCHAGHGCEIKHSLLQNGAKVASLAFVGDSLLGKSARIGSGVITGNRKFDQSQITCKFPDGVREPLGSDYFGVVLGDNSRLGANCVTQPGTHIGAFTWVYPLTAVRGFLPERKRAYHERTLVLTDNTALELK